MLKSFSWLAIACRVEALLRRRSNPEPSPWTDWAGCTPFKQQCRRPAKKGSNAFIYNDL
jgi:hypothetical protein